MIEKIRKDGFQTRNDLNYFLTELKESNHWLYSYYSKTLQMISTQVDGAQKSLIALRRNGHKTGRIQFAKHDQYNAFIYNQTGFNIICGFLQLSKIGKIKLVQHREIPENSEIKQITISRSKTGKWFALITCKVDVILPSIRQKPEKQIGIDVGIRNFAYDSDGHVTPNPLNLEKMLKPLARIQRKAARRQKGSNRRKKAIKFYQIIHERIKNKRKDFLHKLSTHYSRKYDTVYVEKLQKLNLIQNKRFARCILDSGWGMFGSMLQYKTNLVEVSAHNTSIMCSRCDSTVPKTLAIRTHRCHRCGLVLDRDHNAAINILKRGIALNQKSVVFTLQQTGSAIPQELRELTPVEISKRSRKQETMIISSGSSRLSKICNTETV